MTSSTKRGLVALVVIMVLGAFAVYSVSIGVLMVWFSEPMGFYPLAVGLYTLKLLIGGFRESN